MNELQQVLLIFAVVVVIALYFLSRNRKVAQKKESTKQCAEQKEAESDASYQKASHALNELGESHISLSKNTEDRLTHQDVEQIEVDENQGILPFGEAFESPIKTAANETDQATKEPLDIHSETRPQEGSESQSNGEANRESGLNEISSDGKNHVLVVDDLGITVEGYQSASPEHEKPSFGVPENITLEPVTEQRSAEKKEPQVFVILVMSTGQEFSMLEVNQALLGVGLSFTENKIYVKCDNMGNNFIKVANLMEPGVFPAENMEHYFTCGMAMILELPTTVKAPAAMHDLIMMARKVSQRLHGRLYNMERQLLKESDLQSMREEAVKYESEPL